MSKKVFNPKTIPTQQQSIDSPDFNDDSLMPINPYVMRGRMTTGNGQRTGSWSVVNLIDYKYDSDSGYNWTGSKLYGQASYLNISKWSNKFYANNSGSYIPHVDTVTITLDDTAVVNAPTTGVDVWFRWMPQSSFNGYTYTDSSSTVVNGEATSTWSCTRETPCGSWQTEAWNPTEWIYSGTHTETSFNVTVPMPKEYKEFEAAYALNTSLDSTWFDTQRKDVWFQILVTGHSTWQPNPYNYRWIGVTNLYDGYTAEPYRFVNVGTYNSLKKFWTPSVNTVGNYKMGETFISHNNAGGVIQYNARGYLPWNPHLGIAKGNQWNTYHRQRTTFGDIAIFSPKRWRKTY